MTKAKIYQTGTINSLIQAVYDGDTSIGELKEHGNFGLGTFDLVDGELIVCDNNYYRADANGKLTIADDEIKSPFAVVSNFKAEQSFVAEKQNFEELEQFIAEKFISKNLIYAIKVQAEFKSISLRSENCQARQYHKLYETMPKLQHTFTEDNLIGTLVGVWFPHYLQQVNVPGFHFHFVDEARKIGGHVFNFELIRGLVEIQVLKSLQVDLIENDEFYQADLDSSSADAIKQVEQQR